MRYCPECRLVEDSLEGGVRCPNCESIMQVYIFECTACISDSNMREYSTIEKIIEKETTMQDFIDKVKEMWEQKRVVDELKEALKDESAKLETFKSETIKAMEAMDIEKQHVTGCGTIFRQKNFSIKTPKTIEQKEALFKWIGENKGRDVLRNMLSINSQTLNSFYKSELEVAKETGNIDFSLPGIDAPELYYTLGMRK